MRYLYSSTRCRRSLPQSVHYRAGEIPRRFTKDAADAASVIRRFLGRISSEDAEDAERLPLDNHSAILSDHARVRDFRDRFPGMAAVVATLSRVGIELK